MKVDELKKDIERIHILFDTSAAGNFKMALKDSAVGKEEKIISFQDVFSVGPIWQLHEKSGKEIRYEWIRESRPNEYEGPSDYKQEFQKTVNQISAIPDGIPISIWSGENPHEQTGLRYVLKLLKGKSNDLSIINTTKEFSEIVNGTDTVLHTSVIVPERLQAIYERCKYQSILTQLERERFVKEWLELTKSRKTLRIWLDDRIQNVSEDYYDHYLINVARKFKLEGFIKPVRLIGKVLILDEYVGDEFLEYRIRMLIKQGIFEVKGNLKSMLLYSVRIKDNGYNYN